jgi:DNA-binding CsgD family transcriptional regulator
LTAGGASATDGSEEGGAVQEVSPVSGLFERLVRDADGASSIAAFRASLLGGLLELVGADSAAMIDPAWADVDERGARDRTVGVGTTAGFARPFFEHRQRYARSLARLVRVMRAGRPVIDDAVYGTRERQRLAIYREIFLPQNATSILAASARCRGVETATLVFKRHGRSVRFRAPDAARLEATLSAIALADAGFRYAFEARHAAVAPMRSPFLQGLGAREAQVAQLACRGLRNAEIAAMLGTSAETVKRQLRSVFAKVQVSNRTELAMLWAGSFDADGGRRCDPESGAQPTRAEAT